MLGFSAFGFGFTILGGQGFRVPVEALVQGRASAITLGICFVLSTVYCALVFWNSGFSVFFFLLNVPFLVSQSRKAVFRWAYQGIYFVCLGFKV